MTTDDELALLKALCADCEGKVAGRGHPAEFLGGHVAGEGPSGEFDDWICRKCGQQLSPHGNKRCPAASKPAPPRTYPDGSPVPDARLRGPEHPTPRQLYEVRLVGGGLVAKTLYFDEAEAMVARRRAESGDPSARWTILPQSPDGPAVEHPAPWRWDDLRLALHDSNGRDVLSAPCGHCEDLVMMEASERTFVLLSAAPEMEALLRNLLRTIRDGASETSWEFLRKDARAIVDRIDAAKAGG